MVLMMPCIYSGQAGDGAQRLHASGWDPYETNEPMPVQPFSSVRSRSVLSYAPSVRLSICSVSSTGPPLLYAQQLLVRLILRAVLTNICPFIADQ